MGVDLFDIVSYPVWKMALITFGLLAVGFVYGYYMAYEKINERNGKH